MNKTFAASLAAVVLMVSATGCSGMKNFLFGRGAACTACAGPSPVMPPMMEPSCGYEAVCGREPACGYEVAPSRPFGCGLLRGHSVCNGSSNCNCGGSTQSYMPSNVDPYASQVHDPYAYSGEAIGSEVIGEVYNGYPSYGTPIEGTVMGPGTVVPNMSNDNFNLRGGVVVPSSPVPGTVTQP